MHKSLSTALAGAAAALLLFTSACSTGTDAVEKVEPTRAVQIIDAGKHTVIDVRTPGEYAAGHVQGAENIDVMSPDFEQQVGRLDKGGRYLVYCQSGNRSSSAAEKMAELGFTQVVDGGGIVSLQAAGAPVVVGG
jgi:rhodanese-related sulfurtransferase